MTRNQRLLGGLLTVQLLVLLVLARPWAGRAAAADRPLLPALGSVTPERLEIDDGQGGSVSLERAGGSWTLANPKGYPVSAGRVEKLVQDLERVTVGRPIATSPAHHAALKVADTEFERHVRLWSGAGATPDADVFLGTPAGPAGIHVRAGGKSAVYEASGLNAYDLPADAASWIERALVPVPPTEVTGLAVTNRQGAFTLEKRAGIWKVTSPAARAGATLDSTKVVALLGTLGALTISEPVGTLDELAQGFATPEAVIRLDQAPGAPGAGGTAAGGSLTLRIGSAPPGKDDQRYATRSGFPWAVTVGEAGADRALNVTLADLVAK